MKMCDKCAKTEYQMGVCPNGHQTTWNGFKAMMCNKCGNTRNGWRCVGCDYDICNQCANTQYLAESCPNGHQTMWN